MPGPIAPTIYPPATTTVVGDTAINFEQLDPAIQLLSGVRIFNNTASTTITVAYDTPASAGVGIPIAPAQFFRDDTRFAVLHIYSPAAAIPINGATAGIAVWGIV